MIRSAAKILLEVLAGTLAALALLVAVLGWRLSSGPLSLSLLTPTFEEILNAGLEDFQLRIGDAVLHWMREERVLELRVVGVKAYDPNGKLIAEAPEMALDLSAEALSRGVIAPTRIVLIGPEATIVRRREGGFHIGFARGEQATKRQAVVAEEIFEALLAPLDKKGMTGYLRQFTIRQSQLTYLDEPTLSFWRAPDAVLDFRRNAQGISGTLNAGVQVGAGEWRLAIHGFYNSDVRTMRLDADFSEIVPAHLADKAPAFAQFADIDIPVYGQVSLGVKMDGTVLHGDIKIDAGRGELTIPPLSSEPLVLDEAMLEAAFDPQSGKMLIKELSYEAGSNHARVSGYLTVTMGPRFEIAEVTADLEALDMALDFPAVMDKPVDVDRASLKAAWRLDGQEFDIDALTLSAGEGLLSAQGIFRPSKDQAPEVRLMADISRIELSKFPAYWPAPLAPGARRWVIENLPDGLITEGRFVVDAGPGVLGQAPIPDEALRFDFSFTDLTVNYLNGLPPMRNISGKATLLGNNFDLRFGGGWIDTPGIQKIAVSEGRYATRDFHIRGNDGHVEAVLSGPSRAVLALIDQEPLGFVSEFGLEPDTVGGSATVRLSLDIPMREDITLHDVRFAVAANLGNLSLPRLVDGIGIDSGTLSLEANGEGLKADGIVALNGVPVDMVWREDFTGASALPTAYELHAVVDDAARSRLGLGFERIIGGPVEAWLNLKGRGVEIADAHVMARLDEAEITMAELGWHKPAGHALKAQLDVAIDNREGYRLNDIFLEGDDIAASGAVVLDPEGRIMEGNFPQMRLGRTTDIVLALQRTGPDILAVKASGRAFDARGMIDGLLARPGRVEPGETEALSGGTAESGPGRQGMKLEARIERMLFHNEVTLEDVYVRMHDTGRYVLDLEVTGDYTGDGEVKALIRRTEAQGRELLISSDSAGAFLKALDFYGNAVEGKLRVLARFEDELPGSPLRGRVLASDFRVKNAPALAKISSVASLTSISGMLQGEGLPFNGLELPFTMNQDTIFIEEGHLQGPAIGITLDGRMDREAGYLDMNGTIVPMYGWNSFLGNIPVLGKLFVGRENEGMFGITYSVKGPVNNPEILVNPLSALAPGILRRLFEMGRRDAAAERRLEEVLPPAHAPAPE